MNNEAVMLVAQHVFHGEIFTFLLPLMFNLFTKKKKKDDQEFKILTEDGESEEVKHIDGIEKLKKLKASPEVLMEILDAIAQDFLRKKYHIKKNTDYSELSNYFTEKNKTSIADFCRRMTESIYSGEKLSQDRINDLIADLEMLIRKENPYAENYQKKDRGLYSLMNKIKIFEGDKQKDGEYIGKKTKQIINSKLSKKKEQEVKTAIPLTSEAAIKNSEFSNAALSFLHSQADETREEPESDKNIEGIDDFDRIKGKIQQRKKPLNESQSQQ